MIEAITLDFGNTLVPVPAGGLRAVVAQTAAAMADAARAVRRGRGPRGLGARSASASSARRCPRFREVDLAQRVVRILARLRGHGAAAARRALGRRGGRAPLRPRRGRLGGGGLLAGVRGRAAAGARGRGAARAARAPGYRLAILSNWPLAATIDRYVEAAGWAPHLAAVVVSQRVGTIKPHPAIFAAARAALGDPVPGTILHVGDDWAADVVGAKRAGWRAAYLAARPDDSPLPGSARDDEVVADLELAALDELEAGLERLDCREA